MGSIPQTRVCYKCKQEKTFAEYSKDSRDRLGITRGCKECQKRHNVEYRQAHPEQVRKWKEIERRNPRTHERTRRYWKEYLNRNPEYKALHDRQSAARQRQRYAESPEYRHERLFKGRLWRQINPEKARAQNNKRYAASAYISPYTHWKQLLNAFGNKCLRCGTAERITIDHVMPVSLGGSSLLGNLQPLCRSCNASKGARYIDYRDPSILAQVLVSVLG